MDSQANIVSFGDYKFISWNARDQSFPANILEAGTDVDGQTIYLGLVNHEGHKLPAKVVPVDGKIYTSFDGKEYQKNEAFLLVDDGHFSWDYYGTKGYIPETAVKLGMLKGGDVLYVGRARHMFFETPGAIYPGKGVLRIPFGNAEAEFKQYHVLCHYSPATIPSEEKVPEPTPGCAAHFCDLLGVLINRILCR